MKEHNCIFSVFGATGDLANRKLLPALYYLEQEGYLKEGFKIVAIARKEKTDGQYREEAADSIKKFSKRKVKDDVPFFELFLPKKLAKKAIPFFSITTMSSDLFLNKV